MKASNLSVNLVIRSLSSSKPKLTVGKESAIEGASVEAMGARKALIDTEGSNTVAIIKRASSAVLTKGTRSRRAVDTVD